MGKEDARLLDVGGLDAVLGQEHAAQVLGLLGEVSKAHLDSPGHPGGDFRILGGNKILDFTQGSSPGPALCCWP